MIATNVLHAQPRAELMTSKILVTGASGFIGAHTIIELLNAGYEVRGTIRNLDKSASLRTIIEKHTNHSGRLELVAATLTDSSCWQGAVSDCDGIMHIASPVPIQQPKDPEDLIVPARNGVLNVLAAAKSAGIKRIVLTSSVAAVSANPEAGTIIQTAEHWSDPDHPTINAYGLSKTLAEKAAWEFVANTDIELITVNPAMVLGPTLEPDYGSSLEALVLLMRGRYPFLPKISMGIVDVRDVAGLHRLAFEKAQPGTRLLCSNGHRTLLAISRLLAERYPAFKQKLPKRELPSFIFRLLAGINPVIATIVPDLDKVIEYDCGPARALGWQPRSADEAIFAGAESLIQHHIVE